MKKYGLIGFPLGHSMSPVIHKELFKLNSIEAEYTLREVDPEDFENGISVLDDFSGYNVTIPHKTNIIPYCEALSDRAELFGAVNTIAQADGKRVGHNTDCYGFLRALEMADIPLRGNVLLCGSGGVSRMFAFETILAGASLTIAVRDDDIPAAEKIREEIGEKLQKSCEVIRLADVSGEYDLLINGTPVGMYPNVDACVLPKEKVLCCKAVFDAVYNPLETTLIRYAKEGGLKYSNGLPMLVWQAAVAQEIWLGVHFDIEQIRPVIEITERELTK